MGKKGKRLIANNKRARSDHFIPETFETGTELFGTEVKASRTGYCSVKESWVGVRDEEIFIYGIHINPYGKENIFNKDPLHVRKLLMRKSEIRRLIGTIKEKGLTPVPFEAYLRGKLVRVETGLAQGKKKYDKRMTIAKDGTRRDSEWDFKGSARY